MDFGPPNWLTDQEGSHQNRENDHGSVALSSLQRHFGRTQAERDVLPTTTYVDVGVARERFYALVGTEHRDCRADEAYGSGAVLGVLDASIAALRPSTGP